MVYMRIGHADVSPKGMTLSGEMHKYPYEFTVTCTIERMSVRDTRTLEMVIVPVLHFRKISGRGTVVLSEYFHLSSHIGNMEEYIRMLFRRCALGLWYKTEIPVYNVDDAGNPIGVMWSPPDTLINSLSCVEQERGTIEMQFDRNLLRRFAMCATHEMVEICAQSYRVLGAWMK